MVRLVVRLSPLAKAGALITVAGVAMSIYGMMKDIPRLNHLGRGVLAIGAVLYLVARYRMLRR